jgi:Zn-dependent protease
MMPRVPFIHFIQPTYLLAALIAITVHEASHALVAKRLGDRTAELLGRLTLNPLAHLDPIGSLMFLLIGFGWAKPVPIDPRYLSSPKRDLALISLAGPVSNLLLAIVAFVLLSVIAPAFSHGQIELLLAGARGSNPFLTALVQFLQQCVTVNVLLMAFNLLPIAPLDGSKIVQAFVPWQYADQYEEFMRRGPMILLALLIAEDLLGIPLISRWVFFIGNAVFQLLQFLTPWW